MFPRSEKTAAAEAVPHDARLTSMRRIRSTEMLLGIPLMVAVLLVAPKAAHARPDIALTTLDFEKVESSYEQAKIRQALVDAFGQRIVRTAVADPTARPIEKLNDDRERIAVGKRLGARLLVEASVSHGASPTDGIVGWVTELSLFDSEGGEFIGSEESHCPNCALDAFLAKQPELIARLLRHDSGKPTASLTIRTKPSKAATKLTIDGRPFGYLPFEETLFVGSHDIIVVADGYRPARVGILLQKDKHEDVTLALEPIDKRDGKTTNEASGNHQPVPAPGVVPSSGRERSRVARTVGAVLVPVGAAAIIAGAVLLSMDGDPACSLAPGKTHCAQRYNNAAPGGVLVGLGAAAVVSGIVALVVDRVQRHPATIHADADVSPGRFTLGLNGSF